MSENIKKELVKSVNSIKRKLRSMKNKETENDLRFKKIFKPLSDPIENLIQMKKQTNMSEKQNHSCDDVNVDNHDDNIENDKNSSSGSEYEDVENAAETSLSKDDFLNICNNINIPFGIRSIQNKLFMGNSEIKLNLFENPSQTDKMYMITIDHNKQYELTPGLRELLLNKSPNLNLVTEKDKIVYKDMLHETNVHKRNFNPLDQIKGDKSIKYREIIKPMFLLHNPSNSKVNTKFGGELPKLKEYRSNTDLVYWDDPNELIERLKLLIASRDAGNSNHDNEIISIIEELKEADIIKE